MWQAVLFLHLLGVAIWIGGQVTVLLVMPVLRAHGVGDDVLGIIGRRFGAAAGLALAVVVATGFAQAIHLGWGYPDREPELYRVITEKVSIVAVIVVLTAAHGLLGQRVATGRLSPAWRSRIRWVSALNLVLGLAVLWLAAGL